MNNKKENTYKPYEADKIIFSFFENNMDKIKKVIEELCPVKQLFIVAQFHLLLKEKYGRSYYPELYQPLHKLMGVAPDGNMKIYMAVGLKKYQTELSIEKIGYITLTDEAGDKSGHFVWRRLGDTKENQK